jgi:hypothetical protein
MSLQNKEFSESYRTNYIAKEIKAMLLRAKEQVIQRDWDRVYIIDGSEGSGKSLLGLQLGYFLDPTLSLDRITFTGEEFSKAVSTAEKNQCVIFDEAFNGLASTAAMSKMNRLVVKKLMECRQKNLFIIIILPTIFLLQKYVAVFRSKALFHVYVTKGGNRGYYKLYNELNKKLLYLNGKKFYSYSTPYLKNSYRFYGKYPISEEEYRKKKHESLTIEYAEKEEIKMPSLRFAFMVEWVRMLTGASQQHIANQLTASQLPITRERISTLIQKLPEKPKL